MKRLLKRYEAWRSRRQQLSLERWAQERSRGMWQFLLRQAFSFAVLMTAGRDIVAHFFSDGDDEFSPWFYLVQYTVTGIFLGYMAWGKMEGKYKDARLIRRLQTPLDDRIRPR